MLVCVNLGYSNRAIVESVTEQIQRLPYIVPSMTTEIKAEVAKLLKEVLPENLEKFFFSTSGTDAIEAALKIARLKTGRPKIISRYFSYHGSTMGSIAASGEVRRWFVEHFGKAGDVVFAPPPYCYRCPLKLKYPECGIACVEIIDHMIKNEFGVAAVLFEPVVGTNGVIVPPRRLHGAASGDSEGERRPPHRRRGDDRVVQDREVVRGRALGREARHPRHGEGPHLIVHAPCLDSGEQRGR
jgi:taurine--2-oxoglutarate transaminase